MEKQYFLFGVIACKSFAEEDTEATVSAVYAGDGQLHIVDFSDPDCTLSLLGANTGWGTWLQLTKDAYEEIEEAVKCEEIGDWAATDLFDWLQDMDIIDEDEEVEDWYDSRSDMVDMVRDNIEKFYEGD